jgi:hypothetical protein
MPKGFVKHAFRRKADNAENTGHATETAIVLQLEGARAGKRIVFRGLWKLT